MFVKLKHKFDKPLYAVTDRLSTFTGNDGEGNERGTYYDRIWSPDQEKFFSVIPKRYWNDFHLTLITVNHYLPPHVDSNIVSTINFYFQPQRCKTSFYKLNVETPKGYYLTNQTDGHCYYPEELDEVGSFIAEPGDAYLLDIKQIHGVLPLDDNKPLGPDNLRKAITIGSLVHDYDAVYAMLQETGSI